MADANVLRSELLIRTPTAISTLLAHSFVFRSRCADISLDSKAPFIPALAAVRDSLLELRDFPGDEETLMASASAENRFNKVCSSAINLLQAKLFNILQYINSRGDKADIFPLASIYNSLIGKLRPLVSSYEVNQSAEKAVEEELAKRILKKEDDEYIHGLLEAIRIKAHPNAPQFSNMLMDYSSVAFSIAPHLTDIVKPAKKYYCEVGSSSLAIQKYPFMISSYPGLNHDFQRYIAGRNPLFFHSPSESFVISIRYKKSKKRENFFDFVAIIHTAEGDKTVKFSSSQKKTPSVSEVLKTIKSSIPECSRTELRHYPSSDRAALSLITLENELRFSTLTFSVLSFNAQTIDRSSYFSFNSPSKSFLSFLRLLGSQVELKGWPRFAGHMNEEKSKSTYYSEWDGFEIVFHAMPLISSLEEKNRLLAYDQVAFVFHENDSPFCPDCFSSDFAIIIVVRQENTITQQHNVPYFSTYVYIREDINQFAPHFEKDVALPFGHYYQDFLMTKAVNGFLAFLQQSTMYREKRKKVLLLQ